MPCKRKNATQPHQLPKEFSNLLCKSFTAMKLSTANNFKAMLMSCTRFHSAYRSPARSKAAERPLASLDDDDDDDVTVTVVVVVAGIVFVVVTWGLLTQLLLTAFARIIAPFLLAALDDAADDDDDADDDGFTAGGALGEKNSIINEMPLNDYTPGLTYAVQQKMRRKDSFQPRRRFRLLEAANNTKYPADLSYKGAQGWRHGIFGFDIVVNSWSLLRQDFPASYPHTSRTHPVELNTANAFRERALSCDPDYTLSDGSDN
uniref:Uncharacterized protein n=1 Tax=Glossina austeni TaxID=7395 RepID=A0A1A9UN70_GLOAU